MDPDNHISGYFYLSKRDSKVLSCVNIHGDTYNFEMQEPWSDFSHFLLEHDLLYIESDKYELDHDSVIVINPQFTVPITSVVNAYTCPRKVYLSHIGADSLNKDRYITERAVEGNLLHNLFSLRMSHDMTIEESIEATLNDAKVQLVLADYAEDKARSYLNNTASVLKNFSLQGSTEVSVDNFRLGLNGKLDGITDTSKVIELKTSKIPDTTPWPNHNIQANMYLNLLSDDNYKAMVLYVHDGQVGIKYPTNWNLQDTILARNWAYLVMSDRYRPPVLQDELQNYCRSCYQQQACFETCAAFNHQRTCNVCFHNAVCHKEELPTIVQNYFKDTLTALNSEQKENRIVPLQIIDNQKMPTLTEQDHSKLILSKHEGTSELTKVNERWDETSLKYFTTMTHKFEFSEFRAGDLVAVYEKTENNSVKLFTTARIKTITENEIILVSDNILPDKGLITESTNYSIFKRRKEAVIRAIFENTKRIENWLERESILSSEKELTDNTEAPQQLQPFQIIDPLKNYNPVQSLAIARSIQSKTFTLIQGPAGTGKTSVVVEIAHQLVKQGKSVLIAAFTNMAVDNIGLQLHHNEINFLRLGSPLSTNPILHPYLLENIPNYYKKIVDDVAGHIVLTTTSTLGNRNYSELFFDHVILDEAAQMTEPDALIAINHGEVFTLVGDHAQLPSVVISNTALQLGLQVPLFEKLVKMYSQNHILLKYQYRMNEEILRFPNVMFYDNELQSASDEIANRQIKLTSASNSKILKDHPYFLINITTPKAVTAIKLNQSEIKVAKLIVNELLNTYDVKSDDIGIIAPFRLQVAKMRENIHGIKIDTIDRYQGSERDVIIFSTTSKLSIPVLTDPRRFNVVLTRARKLFIVLVSDGNENLENDLLEKLVRDAKMRNLYYEIDLT